MDLVLINSEERVFAVEGQVIQVQSNWCDMGCLECPHKVEEDWSTFADTIRKLLKLQKSKTCYKRGARFTWANESDIKPIPHKCNTYLEDNFLDFS
ncbi:unnamed protein product [Linum trigynum]|uniref:Uncharacterized protein n=1 Tax=Linum trigynum TaxID=586398 RepID=A0AAV2CKP2_9ROSI